jgi:DNA-binding Lrp family transcriptional regulator
MDLDVKDLKILKELDNNPRIRTTKLAKKVRLSQQVVDYRIKRFLDNGVIHGFGSIYNFSKIDYSQYRLFFTFGRAEDEKIEEVLEYLKNHKNVFWISSIGSKWDLFVTIFVKHYEDFEKFLDDIFEKFPNALGDYDSLYVPYYEFYTHKFLDEKNNSAIQINFSEKGSVTLDDLDVKILHKIKNNCRMSSLEIGNTCGVSYKTVQNRIKHLEDKGFIAGYRLFLKSSLLGYQHYLLLYGFNSYGRNEEKKIFSYSKSHKLITQVCKLFGGWSLLFHVRTKTRAELQELLKELRTRYPSLSQPEIIPIFEDIEVSSMPL